MTMELSEPGKAGESDSDESGILERMGEPRPERDAKKNGAVAEPEGCANKGFGINEDVDSSASTLKRGSQLNRVSAISSNLSGKVVDSGFSCCETFISRMVEQLICCDVVTVYVFYLFILCPVDPGDFVVYKDETRTKWEVRYQLVARIHTHAHTRARAHTYTHTHTHTHK